MKYRLALILSLTSLCGCAQLVKLTLRGEPAAPISMVRQTAFTSDEPKAVYVMSNGFHCGLIVQRADIPPGVWPEIEHLPEHAWIEVGWGSEIFYRAKMITPRVLFGALLPNPSVLHIVSWDEPPEDVFFGDLVRLDIKPEGFRDMCEFIHQTYQLDESRNSEDLGPGIYGKSRFYRAQGLYYFPNTCNMWTARALEKGRIQIVPELCSTADVVLTYARHAGTLVRVR